MIFEKNIRIKGAQNNTLLKFIFYQVNKLILFVYGWNKRFFIIIPERGNKNFYDFHRTTYDVYLSKQIKN